MPYEAVEVLALEGFKTRVGEQRQRIEHKRLEIAPLALTRLPVGARA